MRSVYPLALLLLLGLSESNGNSSCSRVTTPSPKESDDSTYECAVNSSQESAPEWRRQPLIERIYRNCEVKNAVHLIYYDHKNGATLKKGESVTFQIESGTVGLIPLTVRIHLEASQQMTQESIRQRDDFRSLPDSVKDIHKRKKILDQAEGDTLEMAWTVIKGGIDITWGKLGACNFVIQSPGADLVLHDPLQRHDSPTVIADDYSAWAAGGKALSFEERRGRLGPRFVELKGQLARATKLINEWMAASGKDKKFSQEYVDRINREYYAGVAEFSAIYFDEYHKTLLELLAKLQK